MLVNFYQVTMNTLNNNYQLETDRNATVFQIMTSQPFAPATIVAITFLSTFFLLPWIRKRRKFVAQCMKIPGPNYESSYPWLGVLGKIFKLPKTPGKFGAPDFLSFFLELGIEYGEYGFLFLSYETS